MIQDNLNVIDIRSKRFEDHFITKRTKKPSTQICHIKPSKIQKKDLWKTEQIWKIYWITTQATLDKAGIRDLPQDGWRFDFYGNCFNDDWYRIYLFFEKK